MSDYGPLFAGLDPGATGGLGLLSADGDFEAAYPFPDTERDIYELLAEYAPYISRAWLESVHAFPEHGRASTFRFGVSYGLLRGMLIAMKIPFEDVSPQKWTKALGLVGGKPGRRKKNLHKYWAQQWFPRLHISNATADAILIADYGRRQAQPPPLIAVADTVV